MTNTKKQEGRLSFAPFRAWYVSEHPTKRKQDMITDLNMSWKTVSKIWGDKLPVRTDVIEKICNQYELSVEQVIVLKRGENENAEGR